MIKRERERERFKTKKKKHEMRVIGGMLLVQ